MGNHIITIRTLGSTDAEVKGIMTDAVEVWRAHGARVESVVSNHNGDEITAIRAAGKDFAALLIRLCPSSRDLSVALTELETCIFWANAAIAREKPVS